MSEAAEANSSARANILARVRRALGVRAAAPDRADAAARQAALHAHGPRPAAPQDLVAQFARRSHDMASTFERLHSRADIPKAVAAYLDRLQVPQALAAQQSKEGVCWPEFSDLDWAGAGLAITVRPTVGHDRVSITGCFCALAETGSRCCAPNTRRCRAHST